MMNIVDLSLVRKGREKLALAKMLGKNEMEYVKNCKYILCGKEFTAARKDKDFCSDAHRTASHKLRENEPSSLARLMIRAVEFDAQFYGHPSNPAVKAARNAALQDVRAAIEAELGIVHVEAPVDVHDEPAPVEVPVEAPVVEAPVVEAPVVVAPVVVAPVEVPVVEAPVDVHDEPAPVEVPVEAPVVVAPVVVAPVEVPVEPLTPEIVREKLRAFMKETGFSQGKIGKLAGASQSTISQFLNEKSNGSEDFRRSILAVVDQDHGMDRR